MTPDQFGRWRSWLGLTQVQVADQLQINKRTVSVYESKGPIPRTVALACMAITDQFENLNYRALVEEQHRMIESPFVVMPHEIIRPTRYRGVYSIQQTGEPVFSAELLSWLDGMEYKVSSNVLTLELPDTRRRDVAIIMFEDETAMDSFMWRWR